MAPFAWAIEYHVPSSFEVLTFAFPKGPGDTFQDLSELRWSFRLRAAWQIRSKTRSNSLPNVLGGNKRHVLLARLVTSSAITPSRFRAWLIVLRVSRSNLLINSLRWFRVLIGALAKSGMLSGVTSASMRNLPSSLISLPSSRSR